MVADLTRLLGKNINEFYQAFFVKNLSNLIYEAAIAIWGRRLGERNDFG